MEQETCDDCGFGFVITEQRCPHCARPGRFPNVRLAELAAEREALDERYRVAKEDAGQRNASGAFERFEKRVGGSRAVLARSLAETERLASSDQELYATFYQLLEADLRVPEGSKWDTLRGVVDHAMFGDYRREIRFAALSLDERGLASYGECFWVLRDDMIAHRASVFEENSVMFMVKRKISIVEIDDLPKGYRAAWGERGKLCGAKLAERIDPDTRDDAFPGILLSKGKTSESDDFVEVHIGGPMTARAFEKVVQLRKPRRRALAKKLRWRLEQIGVEIEDLTEASP